MKAIILSLILCVNVQAQVVISEVLYNEPEGRVNLEWIEIYDIADSSIDLHNYKIIVNNDTTRLPINSFISSHKYAVMARKLISSDGNGDSFEAYWGDSSGFWGDYFTESYPAFEDSLNLTNGSGTIYIDDLHGNIRDSISWDSPGFDGRSIERDDVNNSRSGWHQSSDPNGSTPGRANSSGFGNESFLGTVEPKMISLRGAGPREAEITYSTLSGSKVTIEIYDDSGSRRRKLIENAQFPSGQLIWDGHDNDNRPVAPGLYIILFSSSGDRNESQSIPMVVAP